ncbi:MAG: aspartate 1-decarboxylase [Anaerolineae bacterium]|nr:aspartate 1-decarboxylase [Anaerolineae bacterium]
MYVSMLKAKLHQARVTGADLDYVGSITIATDLLDQVGMYPYEKVLVVDIENGARFETYIIPGEPGSGVIQLNGAAARLVSVGDRVIIMAFAQVSAPPPAGWEPRVLVLDEKNRVVSVKLEGNITDRATSNEG